MQHNKVLEESNFSLTQQALEQTSSDEVEPDERALSSRSGCSLNEKRQFNIVSLQQLESDRSGHFEVNSQMESSQSSAFILIQHKSQEGSCQPELNSDLPIQCEQFLVQLDSENNQTSLDSQQQVPELKTQFQMPQQTDQASVPDIYEKPLEESHSLVSEIAQIQKESRNNEVGKEEENYESVEKVKMNKTRKHSQNDGQPSPSSSEDIPSQDDQTESTIKCREEEPMKRCLGWGGVVGGLVMVLIAVWCHWVELSAGLRQWVHVVVFVLFGAILLCLLLLERRMRGSAHDQMAVEKDTPAMGKCQ